MEPVTQFSCCGRGRRLAAASMLLMAAVSGSLVAAEPASPLTSQALVDQVLRANASIAAYTAHQRARSAEARSADALDDPRLSYAIAPKSVDDPSVDTGHIVGISQTLPWPGKRALRRRQAEALVDAARHGLHARRRELAFEARSAYADWAYLGAALRINQGQQEQLRTLVAVAEQRYAAGSGTQQEPLAAQVRLMRLREAQWQLEAQREAVRGRINALRQAPMEHALPDAAGIPVRTQTPELSRLMAAAERNHPALSVLDARARSADSQQSLRDLARRPDVTLSANHVGTLPREPYRTQVGVALSLPLGQDKYDAATASARAQADALRAERADLAHRLRADVRSAHARWRAAERARQLYADTLQSLAGQSRDAALALYSRGRGDVQAVIDAETEWLAVHTGHLRSQRDAFQTLAELALLTGGALDAQLIPEARP